MMKSGGQYLEYVVDRSGDNILEPAQNIQPGKTYYMRQIWKPNEFRPTVFDASVNWSTIEEIHKTGRIWQLKEDQKNG